MKKKQTKEGGGEVWEVWGSEKRGGAEWALAFGERKRLERSWRRSGDCEAGGGGGLVIWEAKNI